MRAYWERAHHACEGESLECCSERYPLPVRFFNLFVKNVTKPTINKLRGRKIASFIE